MMSFMTGLSMILIGLYIILLDPNLFKKLIALTLINNGVNLMFVALSFITNMYVGQAIVVTSIVINFSITLLGLVLLIKIKEIR